MAERLVLQIGDRIGCCVPGWRKELETPPYRATSPEVGGTDGSGSGCRLVPCSAQAHRGPVGSSLSFGGPGRLIFRASLFFTAFAPARSATRRCRFRSAPTRRHTELPCLPGAQHPLWAPPPLFQGPGARIS